MNAATMTDSNDQYFNYLKGRTRLGAWYRAHVLYPKLTRRLFGRTLDVGCGIGDMLSYRTDTVGVSFPSISLDSKPTFR